MIQYMVWMIYGGHMITEDECGPNYLTFVLRLRENPEKPQPGNWPDRGSNPGPLLKNNDVTPRPQLWSSLKLCRYNASSVGSGLLSSRKWKPLIVVCDGLGCLLTRPHPPSGARIMSENGRGEMQTALEWNFYYSKTGKSCPHLRFLHHNPTWSDPVMESEFWLLGHEEGLGDFIKLNC